MSAQEVAVWREDLELGDSALVLFVGRLVEDKGVAVLADAWRLVRGRAAVLCLVGDGDAGRREWGFGEDVVFTGRLDREQLPVAYAAADLVVVPSIATRRFLEPWGLVCNEAMSQGRPVIATTAVGAAAGGLVRDGETGLVVPAGDARRWPARSSGCSTTPPCDTASAAAPARRLPTTATSGRPMRLPGRSKRLAGVSSR